MFKNKEDLKKWMKAAGVRAIKTMAQAAIAGIGTAAVMGDEVGSMYCLQLHLQESCLY